MLLKELQRQHKEYEAQRKGSQRYKISKTDMKK